MRADKTEGNVFFKKNERDQNLVVMRIFYFNPFVGVAMLAGWFAGIFTGPVYPFLCMTLMLSVQSLLMRIFCKKNPEHPAIKYFILITTEINVFLLTITEGFEPFISYALVPLLSCLYFNRKLCYVSSGFSYVAMIVSVIIRAQPENPLGEGLSSFQWGLEYGLGLSLEFVLNTAFLYLVSLRHLDVLHTNLEDIKTFEVTQKELIAGYSELIVQAHQSRKVNIKRNQAVVSLLCGILHDHSDFTDLKNEDIVKAIISSVPLHDIGLIGVPDAIVSKTSAYTDEERAEYQKHVSYGEELIRKNFYLSENREFLMIARQSAMHHHEHWDGTGYPDRLVGLEIPICARIIAAADELEMRISGDNGIQAVSLETAFSQIQKLSGSVLDPVIVEALLSSRISLERIYGISGESVQLS